MRATRQPGATRRPGRRGWAFGWAVTVALGLGGDDARAQGWITMPNGTLAYTADYTTSGVFTCGKRRFVIGSCLASGNTLVLERDGSVATFTFEGSSGLMTATPDGGRAFSLGRLSLSFSGAAPRKFAYYGNPNVPLFVLAVAVGTTSPIASTAYFNYKYWSTPTHLYGGPNPFTTLRLAPPPPPATYSVLDLIEPTYQRTITTEFTSVDMFATAIVTPEPATVALLATGLAGVAGMARARRARTRRRTGGTTPD